MESRATEVLELRKAKQEAIAREAHYAAVAKEQEHQLQVRVYVLYFSCITRLWPGSIIRQSPSHHIDHYNGAVSCSHLAGDLNKLDTLDLGITPVG